MFMSKYYDLRLDYHHWYISPAKHTQNLCSSTESKEHTIRPVDTVEISPRGRRLSRKKYLYVL